MARITNEELGRKIDGIKDYFVERCDKQDIIIEQNRKLSNKNALAIAGFKGLVIGLTSVITVIINGVWAFLSTKGQ